jgi:hypothetical protein
MEQIPPEQLLRSDGVLSVSCLAAEAVLVLAVELSEHLVSRTYFRSAERIFP